MGDTNRYENDRLDRYADIQTQGKPNMLKRRQPAGAAADAPRPAVKKTAPPAANRPRPAAGAGKPAASRRPAAHASKRVPAKKRSGFDLGAIGATINKKIDQLLAVKPQGSGGGRRRGPDWPMILAVTVTVIILIGIIALCVIGVKNCAAGCNVTTVNDGGAIIYKETETPQSTPDESDVSVEAVPTDNGTSGLNGQVGTVGNGLRSARIRSIGDFVIHDALLDQAERLAKSTGVEYSHNFAPMLNMIREVMGNADFTVANVDGPMGGKQYYKYGYRGYPQFNTPPYLMYALKDAGVDMLTLANNHMLDTWYDGLMAQIENVETVGLYHVGANRSMEEKNSATIIEINGIKVGFMNYTDALNSMEQQKSLNPNALSFGVNWTRNSNVATDAKTLREAGAEVIVCYMHWGTEYKEIDANQNTYAKQLNQAGVDVIIGGHPHIVQPAKWITGTNQFGETQKTLCLYSLGNFLSDQRLAPRDGGIIFDFTIQEQYDGSFEIISPNYLPTWVWRTGNEASGYSYMVLPIGQAMKNRPAGMSDEDYNTMVASYQNSVSVMNTGVGSCINE